MNAEHAPGPNGTPEMAEVPSLAHYNAADFERGRSRLFEAAWLAVQWLLVASWIPGSGHRRILLRLFGARIGPGVVLKPGVRVKFPWRLKIGRDSWIGEDVWIDNLDHVSIGTDCCVSQGAYLCTGSHNWSSPGFDLIVRPIVMHDGAWIAARAAVAPGVTLGEGAVLAMGSVATGDLLPWSIYQGVPARLVRKRTASAEGNLETARFERQG